MTVWIWIIASSLVVNSAIYIYFLCFYYRIAQNKINELIFASTGSIYGEATQIPTKENTSFPIQTSLYGASKVSAEAIISAYSEAYNLKSYIFRFVSILGDRYTHGHVYDFINKLKKNKNIIWNGNENLKSRDSRFKIWEG